MNELRRKLVNSWEIVRHPGLHRDTFFLSASSVLGMFGGFVYWKLVTFIYPPAIVGIAAAGISSATYLAGIGTLGTTNGIVRFLPAMDENERRHSIILSLTMAASATLLFSLIFFGGRSFWAKDLFSQGGMTYVIEFMALALALALSNIFVSVLQAKRQSQLLPVWNLISYVIQITCIILLPRWLNAQAILLALLIQNALTLLLLFKWIVDITPLSLFNLNWNLINFSEFIRYSLGNQIFGLLWGLPTFILPLLVIRLLGADANARFALTWMIYNMLYVIPSSMSVGMLIEGSHTPLEIISQWRIALKFNLVILAPLIAIVTLFASWILNLFGNSYGESAFLLRLLALSTLPLSFNGLFLTYFRVRKKTVILNILTLLLALACFIFSAFFISSLGLEGLGLGWLSAQTLFALVALPRFIQLQRVEMSKA